MGKFASVHDLPGGEQLLICIVCQTNEMPYFQVSTEIHGKQTSINMPVEIQLDESRDNSSASFPTEELRVMALNYMQTISDEDVINVRKMMVSELARQKKEAEKGAAMAITEEIIV